MDGRSSSRVRPIVGIAGLVTALATLPAAAQNLVLTACADERDQPPYATRDGTGLAQRALQAVAEEQGAQLRIVFEPRRRCIASVASGVYDALLPAAETTALSGRLALPLRDGRPDASRSLGAAAIHLVRLKGSAIAWTGHHLPASHAAVLYPADDDVAREALARHGIPGDGTALSALQAFTMLERGRAAVIALRDTEWAGLARDAGLRATDKAERLEPALAEVGLYIAFNARFAIRHRAFVEAAWWASAKAQAANATSGCRIPGCP